MIPKKKYGNAYIEFGIIAVVIDRETRSQCAMCAVVFSNVAFKPVKLERRLRTVHRNLSDRPPECFSAVSGRIWEK